MFYSPDGGQNNSCKYWCLYFDVERSDPPKPTIVNESGVTGNRKDVVFDGNQATISMRPDFGASLMRYELDDDTELIARSQHGNEGTGGATITFGSKVAGEHRIRLLPPRVYKQMERRFFHARRFCA